MSDQPSSSSTNSAPGTPSSSNQPGKTKVFILTPDILKKLGIASKIPNLATSQPTANVSTAQVKNYDINLGNNMKNKLASVLNKKVNVSNETKNIAEATKCDNVEGTIKQNEKEENSVKTKLLSMLTSKLEKERAKSTSGSVEFSNDQQTTNFNNQINPTGNNTSNINVTTVLHNSNTDENKRTVSTVEKSETKVERNESCQNITEIKLKQINNTEQNKKAQYTKITETHTKQLIDTDAKLTVESTSLLKNILSRESKLEIENKNKAHTNPSNTSDTKGNKDNETYVTDAQKLIKHDEVESKQELDATNTEKVTPKARKRKISEESPVEDPELISPVRKSGRKRKLSTLHSDYVTELKLHDGSNNKLPNKARKSTEMKCTENTNESDNLNENNNINASENESQNFKPNKETEKVTVIEGNPNNSSEENISSDIEQKKSKIHLTSNALESNINKNSTALNKQVQRNVLISPKKQIIIHENILIKSPTINSSNIEIKNQGSVKKSLIEHWSQNNAVDSLVTNKITDIIIKNEEPVYKAADSSSRNLDCKLKTYSNKGKSVDTEHTLESPTEVVPIKCISLQSTTAVVTDTSVKTEINSELNKCVENKDETVIKTNNLNDLTPETLNTLTQENKKEIKPDATSSSSIQETKPELKSPETIVLVRRRRSRPGKDPSANKSMPSQKLNSANLTEFENFYSSTVITETNTSQSNEKENIKQTKSTPVTTPIQQPSKQIINIQESVNKPEVETIDSTIDNTETNPIQDTENQNEEVLSDFEKTNIRRPPIKKSESTEEINEKLTNFETKPLETTPIRRRGCLPKQYENNEEIVNKSEPETVDSSIDTIKTETNTEPKIVHSPIITTDTKTDQINENVNDEKEILIDSETKGNNEKPEPEKVDSPIVSTEIKTNQNNENINEKQQIFTDSVTKTSLSIPIARKGIQPKQSKNNEDLINKSESEKVDTPIVSTEIKTNQNNENMNEKQQILSDSVTKTSLSTPIERKELQPEQNSNNKDLINKPELEKVDTPIVSTGIKASQNSENINEKQQILTDSVTKTSLSTLIERKGIQPKQNKNKDDLINKSEPEKVDTPIVSTEIKTNQNIDNKNEKQHLLTDSETKTAVSTPTERKEINQNKEDSITKSKPEKVDTPIVSTEIKTNQKVDNISEIQQILIDSETKIPVSTPIGRKRIQPKPNKNNEDLIKKSEPEKVDTPIVSTEIKTNQNNEDINEQQQILTDSVTKTPISTRIGRKGIQPKQNKNNEDLFNKSESENIDTSIVSLEIKPNLNTDNLNEKQQILTDSATKNPVSTPIRRKGRPPKQNQNIADSINKSKPEIVDPPMVNEGFEEVLIKSEPITPVRRRGRPPKEKKNIQDSAPEDSPIVTTEMTNKNAEEITDSDTTPSTKRGRGRRKKEVQVVEEEMLQKKEGAKYVKIPGRGRKRNRQEMEDDTTPNKSKKVTCALCSDVVDRVHWVNHAMKHNFLCWQVGQPEIDLNDKKLVEYTLFKGLKDNKRFTQFTCPTCSIKKKSVLGFMAHIEVCQLTEEERFAIMQSCTVCNKKVMPQSMKSHMRIHDDFMKRGGVADEPVKEEDLLAPRTKRKAATKAANLIQEVTNEDDVPTVSKNDKGKKNYKKASDKGSVFITFGVIKKLQSAFNKGAKKCKFKNCTFECNDFAEMKLHLNACSTLKSDDYICRYCLFVNPNEKIMIDHVQAKHLEMEKEKEDYKSDPSVSESDDDADGDNEIILSDEDTTSSNTNLTAKKLSKTPAEYIKPTYKIGFLARERRMIREPVSTYLPALKWTHEFCEENYSKVLFENIKCLASKWTPMPIKEKQKYIPRLNKSMSVKSCSLANKIPNLQKKEHEWKEYDLYESSLDNDTTTIFCGGPIWSLAWVPTPIDIISDQYLAVSLQKDFEATYKISESSSGREVIQFWNFGPLECKVPLEIPPTLEFSIAHNHGMIWCMEWCASGYYDTDDPSYSNELKKLGLLAMACSDGTIPIYAIGLPPEEERNKNNIYEIKPAFKLILQEPFEQLLGRWKYQVTKISWSRSIGHNIIAGGYSNGVVCLWDLNNYSPLLRSEEKDVVILKPYLSYQAHTSAISALILYPLIDQGKRWLLTGSWDRSFKYWDANNIANPVSAFGKRGTVTDGVWMSHWLCSFFAYDDVFSLGHTVTTVQNPRDFSFKQCSALASNSVVMSLSASDWASAVAQGTLAGELTATFPRTILMSYDVDKHLKCKKMMLSYCEIIDKTKDPSERRDIMKTEKKPDKIDNEKDDKLFSQYFETKDKEPYVEEPSTYETAREKYGMLFCDFKLSQFSSLPLESLEVVKQSARLREVPTEMYPFTSLNRLVWNPNKQAYLYVACGYQNGFLRLRCVRFMNTHQATMILNGKN